MTACRRSLSRWVDLRADHLREVAPGVLPPSGDEIEVELFPSDFLRSPR